MSLFQKSVLADYLKNSFNEEDINEGWGKMQEYQEMSSKIRTFKEEVFQADFLRKIFVDCLGYKSQYESADEGNLFFEEKNLTDTKKADGAIKIDGDVRVVIELKGTNTKDLKSVENQAFGYKSKHPKCEYVVTSNFEKLRFYINDAVDYQEFNLFKLTKEEYKLLHICLHKENIYGGIPKKLKNESVLVEESITKKLYKDYSSFRRELFDSLVNSNKDYDKLILFNKTQKLLDRFLFILFAEDRHLLPANSISEIIKVWESDRSFYGQKSLYEVYKGYFKVLNNGRPASEGREAIFAYNGGLFTDDEILDRIEIKDDILLTHTKKLTRYDFQSDVSVNILGHIFENSLSEIEDIQNEIAGLEISASKRKKDGVFYTPQYITKYIVENTLGKLCIEKKVILDLEQDYNITEYQKSNGEVNKKGEELFHKLESYKNWLLELKILDPACGSGAFLNEALSFLINEHKELDDLIAKLTNTTLRIFDTEKSILENNIYGVDINEESIEIAKLSMWLRTAKKDRKLTSLNNNIKCGNSLIDDIEVAADKSFNWELEFPDVFARGGFDIIIGNPPYVGTKLINKIDRNYYWKTFEKLLFSEMDLYQIFLYKSVNDLLVNGGKLGFITPNSYFTSVSFKKLRKYLVEKTSINEIIDFPYRFYPFDDVNTETAIIIISNIQNLKNDCVFKTVDKSLQTSLKGLRNVFSSQNSVNQHDISNKYDNKIIIKVNPIIDKLIAQEKTFEDYLSLHKGWMSIPKNIDEENEFYEKGIFTKEELKSSEYLKNNCVKYLEGRDIHRYYIDDVEKFVFVKNIDKKTKDWHFNDKIILQRIVGQNKNKIFATADLENKIIFPNANLVNLKNQNDDVRFYLAVLNSKLISYYYNIYFGESNTNVTKLAFESIPIPDISRVNKLGFIENSQNLMNLTSDFQSFKNQFLILLKSEYKIIKTSNKLDGWYNLETANFLVELEKTRKKSSKDNDVDYAELQLSEKSNWIKYFSEQKQIAEKFISEIESIDSKIDQMVYELYGLTKEEIEIVENS